MGGGASLAACHVDPCYNQGLYHTGCSSWRFELCSGFHSCLFARIYQFHHSLLYVLPYSHRYNVLQSNKIHLTVQRCWRAATIYDHRTGGHDDVDIRAIGLKFITSYFKSLSDFTFQRDIKVDPLSNRNRLVIHWESLIEKALGVSVGSGCRSTAAAMSKS